MCRLAFVKFAMIVALVCGLAGSASAQYSGQLSGGSLWPSGVSLKPQIGMPVEKPVAPLAAPAKSEEKAPFFTPEIVKALPRLGSDFTVLAPPSTQYNAYAYVIGFTDRWIDVRTGPVENPLAEMDQHLAAAGYRRSPSLDTSLKRGVQKVIVYATIRPDGEIDQVQAAALQMPRGGWSAKIGGMAVIGFSKPEQLTGPNYGRVAAVYERRIGGAPVVSR